MSATVLTTIQCWPAHALSPPSSSYMAIAASFPSPCAALGTHRQEVLITEVGTGGALTESVFKEIASFLAQAQLGGIRIPRPGEICDYFLRFPDTLHAFTQAVRIARDRLEGAQLELELFQDPENDDEHLVVFARFSSYDETVMARIRAVRAEYRRLLAGKIGWWVLTTDFRRAR